MIKRMTVAELREALSDCNDEDLVVLTKTGINIYTNDEVKTDCK